MTASQRKTFSIALVAINLLPLPMTLLLGRPLDDSLYFYFVEGAVLAAAAVYFYAKRLMIFFMLLAITGITLRVANGPGIDMRVPLTFWGMYSLCWIAYVEMSKSIFLRRAKPMTLLVFYLSFMTVSIAISFAMTASVFKGWDLVPQMPGSMYAIFLGTAIGIPTISMALVRIIDMVGARHFVSFFLGTYHEPVEKDCVVMFLDMVNSSGIAESLPPKKSLKFIAQFIFDASNVVYAYGGDIMNFTGDGLVAVWPSKKAEKALQALENLNARIRQNQEFYKSEYNITPRFRAGLHTGKVVIGQVGDEKLFLSLYGDVVNTAARLEQMNKTLGTQILFSRALATHLGPERRKRLKSMGTQGIRGRAEPIQVYTTV